MSRLPERAIAYLGAAFLISSSAGAVIYLHGNAAAQAPQWKRDQCIQKIEFELRQCLHVCNTSGWPTGSEELIRCTTRCQLAAGQRLSDCTRNVE